MNLFYSQQCSTFCPCLLTASRSQGTPLVDRAALRYHVAGHHGGYASGCTCICIRFCPEAIGGRRAGQKQHRARRSAAVRLGWFTLNGQLQHGAPCSFGGVSYRLIFLFWSCWLMYCINRYITCSRYKYVGIRVAQIYQLEICKEFLKTETHGCIQAAIGKKSHADCRVNM